MSFPSSRVQALSSDPLKTARALVALEDDFDKYVRYGLYAFIALFFLVWLLINRTARY